MSLEQKILTILNEKRYISFKELAHRLSVSIPTVRKKTNNLIQLGQAVSVYGGVELAYTSGLDNEKDLDIIAEEASKLVQEGDTIYLGPGQTVACMCPYLKKIKDLTVFTNSLPVINALAYANNISVFSIGGQLERSNMAFTLYKPFDKINISKTFISATAIDPDMGISHRILANKNTEEIVSACAKKIIFLASKEKFEVQGTFIVMPIEAINVLVSTSTLHPDIVEKLKKKNIDVRLALVK